MYGLMATVTYISLILKYIQKKKTTYIILKENLSVVSIVSHVLLKC